MFPSFSKEKSNYLTCWKNIFKGKVNLEGGKIYIKNNTGAIKNNTGAVNMICECHFLCSFGFVNRENISLW